MWMVEEIYKGPQMRPKIIRSCAFGSDSKNIATQFSKIIENNFGNLANRLPRSSRANCLAHSLGGIGETSKTNKSTVMEKFLGKPWVTLGMPPK